MINRKKIIEDLLQNMHAMRHKLMVGYTAKREVVITPSQGFVLRFVAKNSSVNVKAITQALNITSSATTQLVDGLVEKGYLIRRVDSKDKRITTLLLSLKAKKLFKKFEEKRLQKMTTFFNVFTDEELTQYVTLNKKITDNIINNGN
ncbi:MAG TPA: MarR family transcriptional regulator [Candidatus Paceibacterota bacterium]